MKILEPITVAGIIFKNRLMFPPLTTGYEAKDGSISKQSLAFYTRLAKGGVTSLLFEVLLQHPNCLTTAKSKVLKS